MTPKVPHGQQCPYCGRFDNRGLSVDMIILKKNNILLGKRGKDPDKGHWALFGGHVEWGESVEDAVDRETKEESNLRVTKKKLFNVYSSPSRVKQVVTMVYAIDVEGEPRAGDDIVDVKWFSLDDLPELAFDHRLILSDYLKKHLK